MPNKRLENALNAGKLINLGFGLNQLKPKKLDLLYIVYCDKNRVEYAVGKDDHEFVERKNNPKTNFEIDSDSPDDSDKSQDLHEPSRRPKNRTNSDENDEKNEILSVQFNQNQNLVATGDSNGFVAIYDIFSASVMKQKSTSNPIFKKFFSTNTKKNSNSPLTNMPTVCLKWHPYSNFSMNFLYFANVNGFIGVLDTESLEKRILIEEEDEISCIDFSIDGACMASVGKDAQIKLYDSNLNNSDSLSKLVVTYGSSSSRSNLASARKSSIFLPEYTDSDRSSSHTNRLQAVKFSNVSNNLLFTGGWDRTVKMWDRRTQNGYVGQLNGPFICGSDAIDVNDDLILTASWVKENALELWDTRNTSRRISSLSLPKTKNTKDGSMGKELGTNEYLYGCKFFSSCNQSFEYDENSLEMMSPRERDKLRCRLNYSTVLACGSGTQSLHLIDYELPASTQHLASVNCYSPLYCLDAIYSCSLIACGGMKRFFTLMASADHTGY